MDTELGILGNTEKVLCIEQRRTLRLRHELILIIAIDLSLVALIAASTQGLTASFSIVQLVLGLLFVLFVPGYTLQAALFPRDSDLEGHERLALSFALSIAIIPPIALLLDKLPWGIRLWPILVSLSLFVLASSMVASYRRLREPEETRYVLKVDLGIAAWWKRQRRGRKVIYCIYALALLMAIASAGVVLLPRSESGSTEFYVVGGEGLAEEFPREITAGQPVTVRIGIASHEQVPTTYRIEVTNAGNVILQVGPVRLDSGEVYEGEVSFVPIEVSDNAKIAFALYRDGKDEVYRSLRLWLKINKSK